MSTRDLAIAPSPRSAWVAQAQANPLITLGLLTASLGLVYLLLVSAGRILTGQVDAHLGMGLMGGLVAFAATALGALPALYLRNLSQRTEDSMLGLAAGMMLAASSFSLILPGLEAGEALTGNAAWGAAIVVAGMALGVVLMLGLDRFTPHQHTHLGVHGAGAERISRVGLFVLAIALHNLPEGMAIGVSFAQGDLSVGLPLTAAIVLQDLPEGLAVAMALRGAGLTPARAILVAGATGFLELIGALLGIGLSSGLAMAYPVGLGLAAGAMLFVVSHEVIPETHRNGHQTPATLGLMGGFAIMMVLDTALG